MDDCVHAKSHPTLCDPMDCSQPNSSIHGILQARTLDWVALPSSRGSSQPRDRKFISYVSCISRQVFYHQCHNGSTRFGGDSVQFSLVTQSCLTLCDPMDFRMQDSLFITKSWSLLKLMSIASVMPSYHLILYSPLLLPPSIFPSIRVFSNESVLCIRCPKYWSFSFSISPSNEYSRLISFRIDWFDCAGQGIQESSPTPQFESINSLVLSFLHSPALTSIYDHRKNHRLDQTRSLLAK